MVNQSITMLMQWSVRCGEMVVEYATPEAQVDFPQRASRFYLVSSEDNAQ